MTAVEKTTKRPARLKFDGAGALFDGGRVAHQAAARRRGEPRIRPGAGVDEQHLDGSRLRRGGSVFITTRRWASTCTWG